MVVCWCSRSAHSWQKVTHDWCVQASPPRGPTPSQFEMPLSDPRLKLHLYQDTRYEKAREDGGRGPHGDLHLAVHYCTACGLWAQSSQRGSLSIYRGYCGNRYPRGPSITGGYYRYCWDHVHGIKGPSFRTNICSFSVISPLKFETGTINQRQDYKHFYEMYIL